jgi:hypothetical protein
MYGLPYGLLYCLPYRLPYMVYPVMTVTLSPEIVAKGGGGGGCLALGTKVQKSLFQSNDKKL